MKKLVSHILGVVILALLFIFFAFPSGSSVSEVQENVGSNATVELVSNEDNSPTLPMPAVVELQSAPADVIPQGVSSEEATSTNSPDSTAETNPEVILQTLEALNENNLAYVSQVGNWFHLKRQVYVRPKTGSSAVPADSVAATVAEALPDNGIQITDGWYHMVDDQGKYDQYLSTLQNNDSQVLQKVLFHEGQTVNFALRETGMGAQSSASVKTYETSAANLIWRMEQEVSSERCKFRAWAESSESGDQYHVEMNCLKDSPNGAANNAEDNVVRMISTIVFDEATGQLLKDELILEMEDGEQVIEHSGETLISEHVSSLPPEVAQLLQQLINELGQ